MADSLLAPPPIPATRPPAKAPKGGGGIWATMTPEERTAHAKALAARSKLTRTRRPSRRGKARHLTNAQHDAAVEAQRPIVAKIMGKMDQRGELPEDPLAVEALEAALMVLRSPGPSEHRTAAARLVLDFTKSKPAASVRSVVRTAEDWVDEMAAEAGELQDGVKP